MIIALHSCLLEGWKLRNPLVPKCLIFLRLLSHEWMVLVLPYSNFIYDHRTQKMIEGALTNSRNSQSHTLPFSLFTWGMWREEETKLISYHSCMEASRLLTFWFWLENCRLLKPHDSCHGFKEGTCASFIMFNSVQNDCVCSCARICLRSYTDDKSPVSTWLTKIILKKQLLVSTSFRFFLHLFTCTKLLFKRVFKVFFFFVKI